VTLTFELSYSETWLDGCSVTWDGRAGYAHVFPSPDVFASAYTVAVADGTFADIDADGRVRGIETIGHPVGVSDLLAALRWRQ